MTHTIWDHGLAVLCGVALPLVGLWQQRAFAAEPEETPPLETREKIALYRSNALLMLGLAGVVVLVWSLVGRSLEALGLTAAPRELPAGVALSAALLVGFAVDTWWQLATAARRAETRRRWLRDAPFMPETWREAKHSLVLIVGAAVGEEVVFRGFLVSYATAFTGSTSGGVVLAVGLPALVFALCHAYQGPHAMAKIAIGGGLLGALFVATGSLWLPIALHFLVDLVATLVGVGVVSAERE